MLIMRMVGDSHYQDQNRLWPFRIIFVPYKARALSWLRMRICGVLMGLFVKVILQPRFGKLLDQEALSNSGLLRFGSKMQSPNMRLTCGYVT